jgi:hypothetical protein
MIALADYLTLQQTVVVDYARAEKLDQTFCHMAGAATPSRSVGDNRGS